jgi:multiple sugar transport system substrate-binding protein
MEIRLSLIQNIEKWVEQTKDYTDKGYNQKTILWAAEWAAGQGPEGKVFGYFMPAWGVDFVMAGNSLEKAEADGGKQEVGNGCYGDWAATIGPESYNWGGTWICAANGTDNGDIVADIMRTICL